MAAPPEISIKDLTGEWVMNKTLSDNTDPVLALQGVGWWTRKAISLATITLHTKQYIQDSITHIDIQQTATGGIKGTTELRTLDWTERSHSDNIFGNVKGKTRWLGSLDDVKDGFLKEEWLLGEEEKGGPNGERLVESFVVNEERGWEARQVWGFSVRDGKRYHARRAVVRKEDEVLRVRLYYNFQG